MFWSKTSNNPDDGTKKNKKNSKHAYLQEIAEDMAQAAESAAGAAVVGEGEAGRLRREKDREGRK